MAVNFLNDIVGQLGSNKKSSVYLSVTPGIGLELAEIDPTTKTVKQYGVRPLDYNEALKEIKDYSELKSSIRELFAEMNINPKNGVVLSIPTVHMGKIELPVILADDMIQEAIISEVEQAYIFKRCEPLVSWTEVTKPGNDSETKLLIYSAIQKPVFDSIKEALTSIGSSLDRLEISLTTTLRALSYSGLITEFEQENTPWTLMCVKSTGYELIQMNGNNVLDYYSEPLALKTYEMEEIYDAINTSAQIALMNYTTDNIVLVSETDMVSAEHLASVMQADNNIIYIESNSFKKQNLLTISLDILPDLVSKISMEAIGIAAINIYAYPSYFEFTGNKLEIKRVVQPLNVRIGGKQYELTEIMLYQLVGVLAAILIIPIIIAMIALGQVEKNINSQMNQVNSQIARLDEQISSMQNNSNQTSFDAHAEIERVIKNNRAKLIAYSAIGESVPKRLWLKYFATKEDGKIDIVGVAANVEDIYIFYRNLKDSIIDSQLRLRRLEMQSNSVDAAITSSSNYEFEITNLSEESLSSNVSNNVSNDVKNKPNNDAGSKSPAKSVSDLEEVEVH